MPTLNPVTSTTAVKRLRILDAFAAVAGTRKQGERPSKCRSHCIQDGRALTAAAMGFASRLRARTARLSISTKYEWRPARYCGGDG